MSIPHPNDSIHKRANEEKLREVSSMGDLDAVKKLVEAGVDVNSQNIINHWTALHWACKRGHRSLVSFLLKNGANPALETINHETCWQITPQPDFSVPFTGKVEKKHKAYEEPVKSEPTIIPNYLANPVFPYSSTTPSYSDNTDHQYINESSEFYGKPKSELISVNNEFVLKVKLEKDKDFIELDIADPSNITYNSLFKTICEELKCAQPDDLTLRKLPNTIVRNDKDVKRLINYQELEIFETSF